MAFPPRRLCSLLLGVASLPLSVEAFAGPLLVPQVQIDRAIDAVYRCPGGRSFKVTYFNARNGQSFALVPVKGTPMLLVAGMSADGVRYQAGFVTWWSKGQGGDLYDARVDPDRPVLKGCTSSS
ncbi:MliC family protein [Dyella sp. C11]|uniref:MliC family protein n=1 Tax=Dyella sp. C11 TaxID=2126991 RepID=UPI000D64E17B|nr:MliC family protein [Dyella sp. C11]